MKKIVVAVSLASLLAGAAFAADISFSYKGSNYFKSSGGNLSYDDRTDCMALSLASDTAGVVLDFDTKDGSLVQDEYYGWISFGIPTGNLNLTAGSWKARHVNRIKDDAGELDDEDFELYKPGVINGSTGKDSDNLTGGKIGMVLAYQNTDSLPGALDLKFGLVKSGWNPDAKAATTASESGDVEDGELSIQAGFVGELAYRQEDVIDVNVAVKSLMNKNISVGLFVSPLMVNNFSLTFGGTFATVCAWETDEKTKKSDWGNSGNEWGVDLRARYQFSEKLSFTTMHNISSGYSGKEDSNTLKLWDMASFAYQIDPRLVFGCTLNAVFNNLDSDHVFTGADLTTSPYLVVKATEKISVTTALRFAVNGLNPSIDGHESMNVTVPVIFAFNF